LGRSIVIHISKPIRVFLRRCLFFSLIIASLSFIFLSKKEESAIFSLKRQLTDVLTPVVEVASLPFVAIANIQNTIGNYFFVHDQNAQLVGENQKLKQQLINSSKIEADNRHLRDLLNVATDTKYQFISARVIGNISGSFIRTILINAGTKDGIATGQAVVNNEGLVGQVVETGIRSSRVLLLTDLNSRIPVSALSSGERAVVSGTNTKHPVLKYVTEDTNITDGELIITSGDGDFFPPGINIGAAFRLNDDFIVKPFVVWHRLQFVKVLSLKE